MCKNLFFKNFSSSFFFKLCFYVFKFFNVFAFELCIFANLILELDCDSEPSGLYFLIRNLKSTIKNQKLNV